MRRILVWIFEKLIFTIFLILLFIRGSVFAVLNFFADWSGVVFVIFFSDIS
ncbi:hypothetical protein MCW_01214 [Cardidatus Bartonella washoeensis 085-0475]|uniref:Uncharacterized protein n=1 Tax=Cardidatus Bartonella washoeensis 085-0475 TaxID=1094564 RepID=J0QG67_9HYPH|nr:hypothetical protein MCW_01214 [Bartonella washoeensis 085-0475]